MRIFALLAAGLAVALAAPAAGAVAKDKPGQVTAIMVHPIHDAQVVRGDDGKDHVEYELLVVNVFGEPVTLSSVEVLDPTRKPLMRIDGDTLVAATQTLYTHAPSAVVPASGAVAVEVDLALPPGTAPKRVTHRIDYAFAPESQSTAIIGNPVVRGPEVAINRKAAMVIAPPVASDGWLTTSACCQPNVHRDLRLAVDGNRIDTAETFAVDWARVENDRLYDGDGSQNAQSYAFGATVLAVADGTIVSTQDGKPETLPSVQMIPETKSDFGGNQVILEIAPKVYAAYAHLQPGTLTVKVGDKVKAGEPLAKLGNTGPSQGPHLHFGVLDQPDLFAGRSLPFVLKRYTLVGNVDFATSTGDHLVVTPDAQQVHSAYPLYGGIQNFP